LHHYRDTLSVLTTPSPLRENGCEYFRAVLTTEPDPYYILQIVPCLLATQPHRRQTEKRSQQSVNYITLAKKWTVEPGTDLYILSQWVSVKIMD